MTCDSLLLLSLWTGPRISWACHRQSSCLPIWGISLVGMVRIWRTIFDNLLVTRSIAFHLSNAKGRWTAQSPGTRAFSALGPKWIHVVVYQIKRCQKRNAEGEETIQGAQSGGGVFWQPRHLPVSTTFLYICWTVSLCCRLKPNCYLSIWRPTYSLKMAIAFLFNSLCAQTNILHFPLLVERKLRSQ